MYLSDALSFHRQEHFITEVIGKCKYFVSLDNEKHIKKIFPCSLKRETQPATIHFSTSRLICRNVRVLQMLVETTANESPWVLRKAVELLAACLWVLEEGYQ